MVMLLPFLYSFDAALNLKQNGHARLKCKILVLFLFSPIQLLKDELFEILLSGKPASL